MQVKFSRIIGQEKAIEILKRMAVHKRVPCGLLFVGAEGVGKKTTALAFAAYLNCEERKLPQINDRISTNISEACGVCSSCRMISSGTYPFVVLSKPEGAFFGINQIRGIQHKSSLKSQQGKRKVYILDGVDKFSREAGGSILKILEEPPGDTVLILIVENLRSLPATILSRCQRVLFPPLSEDGVKKVISRNSPLLKIDDEILKISEGSVSRVILLAEQGKEIIKTIASWKRGQITESIKKEEALILLDFWLGQERRAFRKEPDKNGASRIEAILSCLWKLKHNFNLLLTMEELFGKTSR